MGATNDDFLSSVSPRHPGWFRLGVLYVILILDLAQSFLSLKDTEWTFDDGHPGSERWDLWVVGVMRVALFSMITIVYDACATKPAAAPGRMEARGSSTQPIAASVVSSSENFVINGDKHNNKKENQKAKKNPLNRIERLETICRTLCILISTCSILFIMSKCLIRLIVGIGPNDSMLWFWVSIALSSIMSLVDYQAFKRHTTAMKQHVIAAAGRRNGRYDSTATLDDLVDDSSSDEAGLSQHSTSGLLDPLLPREGEQEEGDEEQKKKRKEWKNATFADLMTLICDDWHLISLAFIFLLGAAVSQVLIPHFIGSCIESIVSNTGTADFQRNMLFLCLCASTCGLCTGLRGSIFTVVGARVNRRIRYMLFQSLLRQEIGFFDITKTGDISSRLSADTTKVGDQVSLNVNFFLRNFVQAIGTLIFMFIQSYKLSLVAFISVPAIVIISKHYGEYIRKLSKLTQEKLAEANSVAEECLSTMATVRSFACEHDEGRLYKEKLDQYYGLNKREARAYGGYAIATTLLPNLVIALVLYYGGQLVLNNDGMTSGKLVSFLLLLSSLSDSFNNMGSIFSAFTQALGAADKVFELIRREPKIRPSELCLAPATCRGDVELRGVVFRYPARPTRTVLHGLDLMAKPGQIVALVGPSGGGKSSCISLLEHFYEPEEGQVLLDGYPVRDYDHQWLHKNVSMVSQEPTLYARSIRKNIKFGLENTPFEPTEEEIRQAAILANAHDFITHLPNGYDTEVGERGVCLSGGQKQRIAIARALCRKPSVLLLDEATSALDAESEHQVQRAIDNMMERGGMTVIVIAHRLSTIKNADKILVIQAGRVVEDGNHLELLGKCGVYAQLVAKQMEPVDCVIADIKSPSNEPL